MSLFNSILSKFGFATANANPIADASAPAPDPQAGADVGSPAPMGSVDIADKMEQLAAANAEKLDWRNSIVDLLKLLGIDSSLAARKELAIELACPADKLADSGSMNTWLHKAVLQKLAANGGVVPAELLD